MKIRKTFKKRRDYGFWDQDIRLSKLSDPLEKLDKGVDFEMFRLVLEEGLSKEASGKGGHPPYGYVLMFRIMILQRYYSLSDDQVEYQINDRMSFMRFLDLSIADDIPDSKTVWHFRERLTDLDLVEDLFALFLNELERLNLVVHAGKIVDAGFVEVPIQRNSREENAQIKSGEIPSRFEENPHVNSQKDTDARRVKKNNVSYFGYKNHVRQDAASKPVVKYMVTDAGVHDSQTAEDLLDDKDKGGDLYADSAYSGEPQEKIISGKEMNSQVCEKGSRNHPLTDEQKESNRQKSKVRSRVEHIFGFMENSMNQMYIQCTGIRRASAVIGLMNLTYNMYRKIQLMPV
jgi:IS5 family transposase